MQKPTRLLKYRLPPAPEIIIRDAIVDHLQIRLVNDSQLVA